MKTIRFFSRFAIICNICFVLFALFNYFQDAATTGVRGTVERIPYIKEIIIILGFPAIAINLIICLVYLSLFVAGKMRIIPRVLAAINVAFLIVQIVYFFFL